MSRSFEEVTAEIVQVMSAWWCWPRRLWLWRLRRIEGVASVEIVDNVIDIRLRTEIQCVKIEGVVSV